MTAQAFEPRGSRENFLAAAELANLCAFDMVTPSAVKNRLVRFTFARSWSITIVAARVSMPLSISFLRFLIVRAWLDFTLVMASCAAGSSE